MRWCACSACAVVHEEHAAVATTKSLPHHEAQPVLENLRAHVRSLAQCEHNARARRDVAHDSAERQPRPPRQESQLEQHGTVRRAEPPIKWNGARRRKWAPPDIQENHEQFRVESKSQLQRAEAAHLLSQ